MRPSSKHGPLLLQNDDDGNIGFSHVDIMSDTSCLVLDTFHEPLCRLCVITYQDYIICKCKICYLLFWKPETNILW